MFKKILAFTLTITALYLFVNIRNKAEASSLENDTIEEGKTIATFDLNNPEKQEQEITLSNNETAVVGLEPVSNPLTRASNGTYKAYWYSGVANAHFYFTVSNNKITQVYDGWHLFVGTSVKSANLTLDSSKQATYYFEFGTPIWDFGGWNGWLRAKIDNNNNVKYSIK
ncbi:DUF5626 family protein [Lysinibacillus sp. RS5]|uniref:DUF5626 family protein n=1 Tax=unclassified Lysinibacillus TaxID=2636778 RepID=UPI0035BE4378